MNVIVRRLQSGDDIAAITDVIHAAYARRAEAGLRYWATHQSVEDTVCRFAEGIGFVAESQGKIVGTITIRPSQPDSDVALFCNPEVWILCQFGVLPELQGTGVGRRLHDAAVAYAACHGGTIVALDTASPAIDLIEMYQRWGYQVVGEADWRPLTNYLSVIMSRKIVPDSL